MHSLDGYDEISLTSPFKVATNTGEKVLEAADLGLAPGRQEDLYGGDTVEEAAAVFDDVLSGKASEAKRNCVIANAAFALLTLEPGLGVEKAVAEAKASLEEGAALDRFRRFVELNNFLEKDKT